MQRDTGATVGDRRLADPVDVATVVVEVADEQHRRIGQLLLPDHVEREREPGRDAGAGTECIRPRAARRLRQRPGCGLRGDVEEPQQRLQLRAGVFGGSAWYAVSEKRISP